MKKCILFFTLILNFNLSYSQTRYLDSCFVSVFKMDVVYGHNKTYNNMDQNLKMRIFQPDGDTTNLRKCFLWMHGGGFQNGSYTEAENIYLCENFAKKGYVTASIEYRLGMYSPSCTDLLQAEYRAAQDYKAAVRYMKKNADILGIDTTQIFVGGSSAGAMTALHCAYWDINEVPEALYTYMGDFYSSGNIGFSDEVAGVVSWAGCIEDTAWLNNETTAFLSIHDSLDPDMPYFKTKACDVGTDFIYGDYFIRQKMKAENSYTDLFTYHKKVHVPNIYEKAYYEWLDTTRHQLYRLIQYQISPPPPLNGISSPANDNNSFAISYSISNKQLTIGVTNNELSSKTCSITLFDLSGKKVAEYAMRNSISIQVPSNLKDIIILHIYCPEAGLSYSQKLFVPR